MSLRKYEYVAAKQTYEEIGDGLVRVTDHKSGKTGVFHWDGRWVEGDLRTANSNMTTFCGGPNIPPEFNYRWPEVPADTSRASGWPEQIEKHFTSAQR